jgi:hypothetical protein
MSRFVVSCAAAVVFAILNGAYVSSRQGPAVPRPESPPSNTVVRDLEYAVTMQGCIFGKRFKADGDDQMTRRAIDLVGTKDFTIEGPKELLQQLQTGHDGHQDEIVGIVVVPGGRQREGDVTIRDIGSRTRIIAGASRPSRDGEAPVETRSPILRLKVQSLEHLDDKCHLP